MNEVGEKRTAVVEGVVDEEVAVEVEEVEGDELAGVVGEDFFGEGFAAEAALDVGEGEDLAVGVGDDFAVEEEVAGDMGELGEDVGEGFIGAVHGAGVDVDGVLGFVDLGADAVEFVFAVERVR